jgi:hypothetical protein
MSQSLEGDKNGAFRQPAPCRPYSGAAPVHFGSHSNLRPPGHGSPANDSVLRQDFCDWELVVSDDEGPEGRTLGKDLGHPVRIRA